MKAEPLLSEGLRLAWKEAAREAALWGSLTIEPAHMLHVILASGLPGATEPEGPLLQQSVANTGIQLVSLRSAIRRTLPHKKQVAAGKRIHRSKALREAFERAAALAAPGPVSTIHILSAILDAPDRVIISAFRKAGCRPEGLREALVFQPVGPRSVPPLRSSGHVSGAQAPPMGGEARVLEQFGKDLTAAAREGRLTPAIGRRKEVLQTIQALARKNKNNPVLVGEAGVGKTAIVEAIALRCVEGKDSQVLGGRRIVELDVGSLLSGTTLRGQFEERMISLIEEASADDNLILFIDEIHTLMGAGGGGQDAAQLLKPALSRGRIRLIGATTTDEYARHIEKDPAMARRFERILVEEPSREDAVKMLAGVSRSLAAHYGVAFDQAAVEAAVDLSIRIDVDNRLPDKAIDLLDRAGARSRVAELSMDGMDIVSAEPISARDVAELLASKMGLPLELVTGHLDVGGARRILDLESFLRKGIKGQDRAIAAVSQRMVLAHAPVMERRGPLATMLFLGPSGVGKTELARRLALFLFGTERNLIRLDMSEFKEEHSVAKLIGAPPGYVGSDQEGQLTGQIRKKPYSVVLLDEVEKAHPRVYDVFLQVFDEGRITDAKGRLADARNCIFVLTTNVRPEERDTAETAVRESLKAWFRPELLNRIDELIPFSHLSREAVESILNALLERIFEEVRRQHGIRLRISEEGRDFLIERGFDPEFGARELRRTVEKEVQAPLSRMSLSSGFREHRTWELVLRAGAIALQRS